MNRCAQAVLAAAALLAAGSAAAGEMPRFGAGTNLVVLSATAVDRRGRPVTDLRPDEFRVFEDGRPQRLEHFSEAQTTPARLLLLVDASGSMNPLRSASARAAVAQILTFLGPGDEAALATFDREYATLVPFTRDRAAVVRGLEHLEPFGSTALHDALDQAAAEVARAGEGRRAVVVVTDGVDTASRLAADDVLARARALDVPIYAVSVVSPLDDPRSELFSGRERPAAAAAGQAQLARYANLSGGASFTVSDPLSLQKVAALIAGELRHQYRLGYDPPEGPVRFRRVEVVTTRKGVMVKTRSGYFPRT